MFRPELVKIVDPGHGLVKLAKAVDWERLDEMFGKTYCPDNGRPAISTRLMVSLQYLKYTYDLSDDDVRVGPPVAAEFGTRRLHLLGGAGHD